MSEPEKSELDRPSLTIREKIGDFVVLRQETPLAEKVCREFLERLDDWCDVGTIHKPGTRTHAFSVPLAGRMRFVKSYNVRGLWYVLSNSVRTPRAVRSWNASWRLMELGIRVPEPLLCILERRHGLLGRSYFLTNSLDRAENLKDAWTDLSATQRLDALDHLGSAIGTMHRGGFRHGDLKWGNILLCPAKKVQNIFFIDFDGSQICPRPLPEKKARKDLARFLDDLRHVDGSRSNELKFQDAWTSAFRRIAQHP